MRWKYRYLDGESSAADDIAPRITAGGKTLTYTADTGPSDSLNVHASGSDLVACRGFAAGTKGTKLVPSPHDWWRCRENGSRQLTARRLMLTHIAPTVDPQRSVADAESEFEGQVSIAVPGNRVTI